MKSLSFTISALLAVAPTAELSAESNQFVHSTIAENLFKAFEESGAVRTGVTPRGDATISLKEVVCPAQERASGDPTATCTFKQDDNLIPQTSFPERFSVPYTVTKLGLAVKDEEDSPSAFKVTDVECKRQATGRGGLFNFDCKFTGTAGVMIYYHAEGMYQMMSFTKLQPSENDPADGVKTYKVDKAICVEGRKDPEPGVLFSILSGCRFKVGDTEYKSSVEPGSGFYPLKYFMQVGKTKTYTRDDGYKMTEAEISSVSCTEERMQKDPKEVFEYVCTYEPKKK